MSARLWMCSAGPKADIYHAARVGDLDRIKHLVEDEEIDVNSVIAGTLFRYTMPAWQVRCDSTSHALFRKQRLGAVVSTHYVYLQG